MKFENQYLTYEEYRFLGGKMELMPFNLLEFEVRKIIDGRTQRRLLGVEEIPQTVKLCVNKMINDIEKYINEMSEEKQVSGNIASENTDGYSVTYVTTDQILQNIKEVIKSKQAELEDIMMNYLIGCVINGKHIMYNGVN